MPDAPGRPAQLAVLYALCEWRVVDDPVVREATKLQSVRPGARFCGLCHPMP